MTLCELEFPDVEEMSRLLACAFARESNWAPRLRRALALGPGNWLGVRDADGASGAAEAATSADPADPAALVGMGGITVMGAVAYVGFVAVHPSRQGRGIARAIMERLLALAAERGCPTLLLDASQAGRPLYERLGFVEEDEVGLWRRDAATAKSLGADSPHSALSLSTLAQAEESVPGGFGDSLREATLFDSALWGADRSALLTSFAAEDPASFAIVRRADDNIAGYAILQRGDGVLGPWLARSPDAARKMLDWAFAAERPAEYEPGRRPAPAGGRLSAG